MEEKHFEIIVLGVGGMGSAALYDLAKRGLKVCGVEQFGVAHDRGSSHGDTRIIRKAYFEHPDYMPLLERTYELWQSLQEASGQQLAVNNGLVVVGQPESQTIRGLEACYKKHALPHERLSRKEAGRRFPQFDFPAESAIFFDPFGGYLLVEPCVEQHTRLAVEHGAVLLTNEKVLNWHAENGHVTVATTQRTLRADKLIITAGAWATQVLTDLGLELEIWRKPVLWYHTPHIEPYGPDKFPTFYFELSYGGFYGFPAIDTSGVKIAEHLHADVVATPEALNREFEAADESLILRFLSEVLPGFKPTLKKHSVCMYIKTPDDHFILDLHPVHENVILGAGFSGHGFKFAPVVGEILGDLAIDGTTSYPIAFLRLERLLKGKGA
ncbi:MAG: N-methyl-L-tryptophan oxidase [bacterium]